MRVEKEDFVKGAFDGANRVARRSKEDAFVDWFEDMEDGSIDYYILGNMLMYEAIHGNVFDRLKGRED
ncbi:hypothetical protein M199_gp205 [Halogranum tailed virus 1]|uniref:Uncharacterized protein n=1 Tax=Halogranum tailed virus 1 TaxID=1273749 RepID=R4TGS9_9CAUD|nr:hypothetical protein M199_gp205 [Halogranum tailed virus 1]AGM11461.1 hypothetical protein HGTV1_164 [Halogranum tailed virus 1]